MDVSIIVPVYNEDESLPELCSWIEKVADQHRLSYEVLLIDDGSTDNSWKVIEQLRQQNPCIKGIKFQRNYGKSAALNEGFLSCSGNVVITMDADLQDSPDEIPALHQMVMEEGWDIVSGWKKKGTTRSKKEFLLSFSTGLRQKFPKYLCTISTAGSRHIVSKWSKASKYMEKCIAIFRSLQNGPVSGR